MIHLTLFKKFGETIVKASIYDRDLEIMTSEGWLRTGQEAIDSVAAESDGKDELIAELQARIQELSKPEEEDKTDLTKKNGNK